MNIQKLTDKFDTITCAWRAPYKATSKMALQSQGTGLQAPVDVVKLPHPRELVWCQIFNHSSPPEKKMLSPGVARRA